MEKRTIRFGVFELDGSSGELRKSGIRIKLQEQPLRILEILLDRRGQLVSRDEMRDLLWPADISVDFDRSLNTAVNKLREALGDSAQTPRFIETIPRRGYRFLVPVVVDGPERQLPAKRELWPRFPFWLVPVFVAAVTAIFWRWQHGGSEAFRVEPRPLTSYPGIETQACFSPDGAQVAFTWNGENQDNFDVYVKALGAERPLRLTTAPEADLSPAWSPRGDRIAFLRSRGDATGVYGVPATGGPERHLLDIHAPVYHYLPSQLAWMPDGESLVLPDREGDGRPAALFVWSLRTGRKRQITFPPPQSQGDFSPAVSPDGVSLLFSRGPLGDPHLYRTSLGTAATAHEITVKGLTPRGGAWALGGGEIVAIAGTQHWTALWMLSPGGRHSPIPLVKYPANHPAAPLSGRGLAYTRAEWDANIWRMSRRGGRDSARPFITSTYLDHLPALAPKGDHIAFVSTRDGAQGLYVCDRDGGGILKLVAANQVSSMRWSPTGDRLVFSAKYQSDDEEIYMIKSDGSGLQRLTNDSAADVAPAWSGDGAWIYFGSNRLGVFEIWKMPASGGQPQRVTHQGGYHAQESKDGRFLFFVKAETETSLWRQAVNGGREGMVLPSLSTFANFAVLEDGIVFIPRINSALRSTIEFLDFSTGTTSVLMRLDKRPVWGLAAQQDLILFTQVDRESTDLMIIDSLARP